jgi:methylglutaconyl-CoA hydratase
VIRAEQRDGVLTVSLGRPEAKNALNLEMVRAFRAALAEAGQGEAIRALVLRSSVPGYFSVGMDLAALNEGISSGATSPEVYEAVREYVALLKELVSLRCVSIAAVGGMAVGGGVDLLASCDVAIASDAAAFSIAQLRKGIFPLTTSGVVVPRIGQREFIHWLLTGQNWSAKKAREMGLVSEVVAADALDARVEQYVKQILGFNADALRLGIDALRVGPNLTPRDRLDHLGTLLALNCQIPRGPKNAAATSPAR